MDKLAREMAEYISEFKFENEMATGVTIPKIDCDSDLWKAKQQHVFMLYVGFNSNRIAHIEKGKKFKDHPARKMAMAAMEACQKQPMVLVPPEDSPLRRSGNLKKLYFDFLNLNIDMIKPNAIQTDANLFALNFYCCEVAPRLRNVPVEIISRMDFAVASVGAIVGGYVREYAQLGTHRDGSIKGKINQKSWRPKAKAIYMKEVASGGKIATAEKLSDSAKWLKTKYEKTHGPLKRAQRSFENLIKEIREKS